MNLNLRRKLRGLFGSKVGERDPRESSAWSHENPAEFARSYWKDAKETLVADSDYYKKAAQCIQETVVPLLGPGVTMVDVGCGDGSYTLEMAPHCAEVLGLDISPALVQAARRLAEERGIQNVRFKEQECAEFQVEKAYDVVSCMGVLVCLVDDREFKRTLTALAESVAPGGHLVLRETISGRGRTVFQQPEYVACYRTRASYADPLQAMGLSLVVDVPLAIWSKQEQRTNHMWIFKKANPLPVEP